MAKGYRPLCARASTFEVQSGKLVLTGPWVEHSKRLVQVSVFPDDVKLLKSALEAFEREEACVRIARKTAKEERKQKRDEYAARKAQRDANTVDGVRVIGD